MAVLVRVRVRVIVTRRVLARGVAAPLLGGLFLAGRRVRLAARHERLLHGVLHRVDVEPADAQQVVHGHLRVDGALDGGQRVDGAHALLEALKVSLVDEVTLVEHQPVGEGHLLHRFVDDARGLLLVEVHLGVLGVHERDHAVQHELLVERGIQVERLNHGRRVGQARGLDDDVVEELAALRHHLGERRDEVVAHRAAHAAVEHHHYVVALL
mmetsp:Transcript_3845/g.15524  ORF Transcript_3845/g.15524 Transcript_3845/m.15524 type:complete len:212 (-) Transcript_3845:272-907(-)